MLSRVAAHVQNTVSPHPRGIIPEVSPLYIGTKQQAMPELMKKKVYFSVHAHHHKHIEQQAVIYLHVGALVCKRSGVRGPQRHSIQLASVKQPFGCFLLGHFPRESLSPKMPIMHRGEETQYLEVQ